MKTIDLQGMIIDAASGIKLIITIALVAVSVYALFIRISSAGSRKDKRQFVGVLFTMDNCELIKKWLSAFGKGVDKKLIEDHVISYGNHLWHLFTWGNVPCLKGDEARKAFDDLQYTEAIRFYDGYANHIEDVSVIEKISAKKVDKDKNSDVYIAAKDFSWTYVRTHEFDLGPYLCIKK